MYYTQLFDSLTVFYVYIIPRKKERLQEKENITVQNVYICVAAIWMNINKRMIHTDLILPMLFKVIRATVILLNVVNKC